MTREQLEHIIRAATQIVDDPELVIVGSQAVLGQFPDAPPALRVSNEADVYPRNKPELADLIDGTIGELSPFHETFGYYAHGVGQTTATLPEGWQERLVAVRSANTRGSTGWCLELHDLLISKLVVGREKDLDFARESARAGLVAEATLRQRLAVTALPEKLQALVAERITGLFGSSPVLDGWS